MDVRPTGAGRARVSELQRARLVTAAIEAVADVGYAHLTVAQVITRARVSRKTFYDVFEDCEDCFMAAFEQTLSELSLRLTEAYERESSWREGLRAAMATLLLFMDAEPGLARLCVVETLSGRSRVLERRFEVLEELARAVDRGRSQTPSAREPPPVTAEGVVGAIVAILHARLLTPDGERLANLLGPLMSIAVLPYLGARVANRELERPVPEPAPEPPMPGSTSVEDPLEGLNIRLTYRTILVLVVLAEHPGASNREVADGSGIIDQGQISKLLGRLAGLGLIENYGEGRERGAANAWRLTARGVQVERATRPKLLL